MTTGSSAPDFATRVQGPGFGDPGVRGPGVATAV
jgi:hypothetical protein